MLRVGPGCLEVGEDRADEQYRLEPLAEDDRESVDGGEHAARAVGENRVGGEQLRPQLRQHGGRIRGRIPGQRGPQREVEEPLDGVDVLRREQGLEGLEPVEVGRFDPGESRLPVAGDERRLRALQLGENSLDLFGPSFAAGGPAGGAERRGSTAVAERRGSTLVAERRRHVFVLVLGLHRRGFWRRGRNSVDLGGVEDEIEVPLELVDQRFQLCPLGRRGLPQRRHELVESRFRLLHSGDQFGAWCQPLADTVIELDVLLAADVDVQHLLAGD